MKKVKYLAAVIGILGLVIMLGSVGALELDEISFARGAVQCVIGLVMFCGGTLVTIGG
jgi:hypothetical protein